ncbi:MAG TPA: glycosyltransferase [Thermoleophilaceae bacterium]|nr:glycosyltransferase [Thermoleophilaceae bacterium]
MTSPDIALVSPGTTFGWRHADAALARHVREAGASCAVVPVPLGRAAALRRTMATTDLVEALAARRAACGVTAGAIVFSTITAALLQPGRDVPTAVRFDGLAAVNRPGPGGAWQRRRERTVLAASDLLLPWSEQAAPPGRDALVLPPPVETAPPAADSPDVLAYAANPDKRGLDVLCAAWERARSQGASLGIGGLDREQGLRWLSRQGGTEPEGVRWLGAVERRRWLELVAGARVFLSAARIEDWGMAQMEALAAGTPLVCAPAPGGNAALALARELAPGLVAPERDAASLGRALAAALALDRPEREVYAGRAKELLAPYGDEAVRRRVAEELLPRLLSRSS